MTRNPVRPTTSRRLPSVRYGKRTPRGSTSGGSDELRQTDTDDTVEGDGEQTTRTVSLSARDRLVLTCLVNNGGEQRIIRLAHAVTMSLDGRNAETTADVQRMILTVRSIIEELAEQGVVTYSESRGRVQLA